MTHANDAKQPIALQVIEQQITLEDIEKRSRLSDIQMRERVGLLLMGLFLALNLLLAIVIGWMISFDHDVAWQWVFDQRVAHAAGKPPPTTPAPVAVIGGNVVIALIAGTVAQVGAAAIAITTYLFPKR